MYVNPTILNKMDSKKHPKKKSKTIMDGKYPVSGPKSESQKMIINNKLKELYFEDGITYTHAAEIACCSRQYASITFKQLGDEIAQYKEKDETWIEKNDRVRDRALEGLSKQLKKSDSRLVQLKNQLTSVTEMQINILPNTAEKIQNETSLGEFIKTLGVKDLMDLYTMIQTDINMWKNYAYLIQTIGNNLRAETTLNLEVQQQYDSIEIMPPPSEILNAEIERRIAAKQGLTQPTPEAVEVKVKKK